MNRDCDPKPAVTESGSSSLVVLAMLALLAGAVAGFVGAIFRLCLVQGDRLRDGLINWSHERGVAGFFLVAAGCSAATAAAAWLVRRFSPPASGSGIPHVEAVRKEEFPPAPLTLIPVKFGGGVLAIGSGLALGREGPCVQMSASLAYLVGMIFRRDWIDRRALLAAGAGAGLATAFNAPISGAVFVLEELVRRFETRIAIAALGASGAAMIVARVFLGDRPEFQVQPLPYFGWHGNGLFLILGAVMGLVAVASNQTLVGTIAAVERFDRWPVELRAALIGTGVGMLAWWAPGVVGGGDSLTQGALGGQMSLGIIPLAFLIRFGLGPVSYAAQTPGGLFAPMLVLGAQLGLLFGSMCWLVIPGFNLSPVAFAVVGMTALFTGVVRAPVTGIVLIIEMTGSFTMLLPMLAACFAAMLVPTLLRNPPIYDSLALRPSTEPAGCEIER